MHYERKELCCVLAEGAAVGGNCVRREQKTLIQQENAEPSKESRVRVLFLCRPLASVELHPNAHCSLRLVGVEGGGKMTTRVVPLHYNGCCSLGLIGSRWASTVRDLSVYYLCTTTRPLHIGRKCWRESMMRHKCPLDISIVRRTFW